MLPQKALRLVGESISNPGYQAETYPYNLYYAGNLSRNPQILQSGGYDKDSVQSISEWGPKARGHNNKNWSCGMLATLHKSGNGLNYNPHVHLIATKDLINAKTRKVAPVDFVPYSNMRIKWMNGLLKHLVTVGAPMKYPSQDW